MSVRARRETRAMTTDELLEYQRALYVVAAESAEKVRRQGGSARLIAEEFDRVVFDCGWPEPCCKLDP